MKIFKLETYKEYSIFFWIIFVSILGIIASLFYSQNKIDQSTQIKSSLDNIYFQKTIKEITNSLNPRYTEKFYISKSGDTHETIVNKLDISKKEKAVLLSTIASEKSQIRNKEKGLKILKSRIYDFERQKIDKERSEDRKSKIGTGDRSERIRTYNFPQGRVTDHRINLTLHKLEEFMEGEIFDEMIENLILQAQQEELSKIN
ncbi:hypothetical protein OA670_02705 [Candidatus Pelagibacter sp.]|nr:hypothetical protein [Candidatus Pelagibacter sp.]